MELSHTDPKTLFFLKKLDLLILDISKNPGNINENIYTFLRDKELRSFLDAENIDMTLLPHEEEWNK